MDFRKLLFLFVGALGWAWCATAAEGWLTPAYTAAVPYAYFPGAALTLPNGNGWTVFNASASAAEASASYATAPEGAADYTPGTLLFVPPEALQEDEQAYLTLGIRAGDGVNRITMKPSDPTTARMRTDRVYATVRFIPSDATPDVETLKRMYPSYAESQPDELGSPIATAAKLGLCVLQDGYFYVSRVRGSGDVGTTGLPKDFVFEFCQTKVRYVKEDPNDTNADPTVGNGDVTLCVEFRTFQLPPDEEGGMEKPMTRAFRVLAKPADADDSVPWVSLTAGRGYAWAEQMSEQGVDYAFDWSSFEASDASEWLYAFDGVVPFLSGEDLIYDVSTLNTLSEMGFSASEGGLLKAWLDMDASVQTLADLSGWDAAQFTPYLADISSGAFAAYADWAAAYDVMLSDWLGDGGISTAAFEGQDVSRSEEAFDAFLLYMDPASVAARRLTVAGIVPEADTVTISLRGPDGSQLATALGKGISRIRLYRAPTLEALPQAEPTYHVPYLDASGNVTLVVPRQVEGVDALFLKAELVSVFEGDDAP